jgi:hypothetical protein
VVSSSGLRPKEINHSSVFGKITPSRGVGSAKALRQREVVST